MTDTTVETWEKNDESELLSNCCAWEFDPLGDEKEEGIWQERCLKCGKLCEPLLISKRDIENIHRCIKFNSLKKENGEDMTNTIETWEEKFDRYWLVNGKFQNMPFPSAMKDFIRSILSETRKEIKGRRTLGNNVRSSCCDTEIWEDENYQLWCMGCNKHMGGLISSLSSEQENI